MISCSGILSVIILLPSYFNPNLLFLFSPRMHCVACKWKSVRLYVVHYLPMGPTL